MINYVLVLVGGACGSVCRFASSSLIRRLLSTEFPVATLLINLTGSFLIGILTAALPGNFNQQLIGTGFIGGFTTFSTFQVENVTLFQKKNYKLLSVYVFSSLILGILLAILGLHLGHFISR